MIPSHFVQLESMPVTNNDKVDVRALQERDDENYISLGTTYIAPGTNLEKMIAEIWKQVLGVNQVGIYDHFFELGGNSLNIIQINERLKNDLNIDITVMMLFRYPTIYSLSQQLKMTAESRVQEKMNSNRVQVIKESKNRLKQRRQRKRDSNE